jgi:uncharacterized lipoprotein YajG
MRILPYLIAALFLAGCGTPPASKQITVPLPALQYSDP